MPANLATNTAMDRTLAQIEREFGRPFHVGIVRKLLRFGVAPMAFRARYGARARQYAARGLDGAIAALDQQYRDEKRILSLHGALSGRVAGLPHMVTKELRLVLRWSRRHDRQLFPRAVDLVLERECAA